MDPLLAQLERGGLGDRPHAEGTGGPEAATRGRATGGAARHLDHRRGSILGDEKGTGGREERERGACGCRGPRFVRVGSCLRDRPAAERPAAIAAVGRGGVDDEIDAAVSLGCLLERRPHARLIGHVGPEGECTGLGDAGQRRLGARDACHGPPLRAEQVDDSLAEVAGTEDNGAPAVRCRSCSSCASRSWARVGLSRSLSADRFSPLDSRACASIQSINPLPKELRWPDPSPSSPASGPTCPSSTSPPTRRVGLRRCRARLLG